MAEPHHVRKFVRLEPIDGGVQFESVLAIDSHEDDSWPRTKMKSQVDDNDKRLIVAKETNGNVVGFMAYTVGVRTIYLNRIVVGVNHRRQEIGTQLLEFCIKTLRYYTKRCIRAYVPEANLAAQLFLRECGFFTVPPYVSPNLFHQGENAYLFEFC